VKIPNLQCEIVRSAAGMTIASTGLYRLFTHIVGATEQVSRAMDQTSVARTQLLSLIVVASSLNTHTLGHDLLSMLWPLLPSIVGPILLWSAASCRSKRNGQPCAQWV